VSSPAFHLAFPVTDLAATREFFVDLLGCREGRSAARWADFDFRGHQLSAHLVEPDPDRAAAATNPVDGRDVPVRHFGLILEWDDWEALARHLEARAAAFLIPPHVRFRDSVGEQATMFLLDPSGNALEFKAFRDSDQVFARGPG